MSARAWALLACLVTTSARAASEPVSIELRPHEAVLAFAVEDLDGDGRPEVLVASSRETGPKTSERLIGAYTLRRDADGARSEPLFERSVPDDVVAFAIGDLLGAGRRGLVYLTGRSVFALDADGRPRPVLRGERLLFSMPARDALPYLDLVYDLDGDGRDDLVVPEAKGYAVFRQTEGGMQLAGRFDVGSDYASEPLRRRRRIARRQGPVLTRRTLRLVSRADVNADARTDLIAMRQDSLLAFPQAADGSFPATAVTHRLISPEGVLFASADNAPPPEIVHADVDGDGRADFVVPELDLRELITRLRIFVATPDGLPEQPTQILKLSSLGAEPELIDLNGDGYVDLGCATFRSDRLLSLAAGEIKSLDFTYYGFLFLSDQGRFSTRPDLRFDASWPVPEDPRSADERAEERENDGGFIHFVGDFDADGTRDAALFTAEGELSVFAARASGDDRMSLSMESEPLLQVRVPPTERVRITDLDGDGKSDVLLQYPESIRLVLTP